MPLMRSPDGSETIEVPQDQVEHYRKIGAMLVRPAASGGASTRAPAPPPMPDMSQVVLGQDFEPIYSGTPDEPLEAPPWWLDPVEYPGMLTRAPARLSAAVGGVGARSIARLAPTVPGTIRAGVRGVGEAIGSAKGRIGGALGRLVAKQIPGVGQAIDVAETLAELGGRGVGREVAEELPEAASRAAGEVVSELPSAASRAARHASEGRIPLRDPVTRQWRSQAELEALGFRPKLTPKPAPKPTPKAKSKPKKAESKAAPKKAEPGGVTTKPQRGQSGPALEQRAKMRAKYKSQRQSEGLNPAAQSDDLESLLQRSIELEQELGAMGISPMQRALARRTLGQAGGSAAGLAALAQILGVHDDQGGY